MAPPQGRLCSGDERAGAEEARSFTAVRGTSTQMGESSSKAPILQCKSIGISKPGIKVVLGFRQRLRSLCGLGFGRNRGSLERFRCPRWCLGALTSTGEALAVYSRPCIGHRGAGPGVLSGRGDGGWFGISLSSSPAKRSARSLNSAS